MDSPDFREVKLQTRRKLANELTENTDFFGVKKETGTTIIRTEPFFTFYAVLKGEASFTVGDMVFDAVAPTIVPINAFELHNFTPKSGCEVYSILLGGDYFSDFTEREDGFEFVSKIDDEKLRAEVCEILKKLIKDGNDYDYYERKATVYLIISRIIKGGFVRKAERSANAKVSAMIRYIYDNSEKNISLKTLADEFGYVPMTVSHIFSKNIGKDLRRFVNEIRIRKAHYELLDEKNARKPLSTIAKSCGFNSVATFHRIYKEYYGCSPREYTNKN